MSDYDCTRCHDSERVIRYFGLGQSALEPCPACTLEGMDLHPDELYGGPYEGMDSQEARYAAGEKKPLTRLVKDFMGIRPTPPESGGERSENAAD